MIRLKDQQKNAKDIKYEENKELEEYKKQTEIMQTLQGEFKEVEANHHRIKSEYNEFAHNRQGPNA